MTANKNTPVDVLEVMDSGYWRLFGKLHTLIEDSNNGPKHGSLNTKQLRDCMADDAEAVAVANEARAAVAELIEAASDVLFELRDKSDSKKALIAALSRVRGAE